MAAPAGPGQAGRHARLPAQLQRTGRWALLAVRPQEVLGTPFLLIGTINEIADQLRERRERYGFSFITVHEPYMRVSPR
ncbi:MAG: hypothetical protein ACR2MP_30310 [Streptosporangiaceae bacterium]